MSLLRKFAGGVRALLQKRHAEREMDEDLGEYLQAAVTDKMRSGMSREDALRAARMEMGSLEAVKENIRSAGWESTVESIWQDLHYAARLLRKHRGFTVIAVLTLALGIGANTAIFSLIDAFLLRELSVKDPQQLVLVNRVTAKGGPEDDFPYATFEQFRDRSHSLSGIFAWDSSTMSVTVRGQPEFLYGDFVSGSYFDVLGVRPLLAADLDEYLGDHRSLTTFLSFFGALALVLAAIGLYGTMSYAVGRRTKELGIRMALGARRSNVLRMVLREALSLAALGVIIGIPIAAASERLLKSMLFGVTSTDPITIVAAVLVMLVTAALAGFVPARRATKVDPIVALRYE